LVVTPPKTGSVAPKPVGGSCSSFTEERREVLRWLVFSHPDPTLAELIEFLREEIGFVTSDTTLCRVLSEMGITGKRVYRHTRREQGTRKQAPQTVYQLPPRVSTLQEPSVL
jgi:transposase